MSLDDATLDEPCRARFFAATNAGAFDMGKREKLSVFYDRTRFDCSGSKVTSLKLRKPRSIRLLVRILSLRREFLYFQAENFLPTAN